MGPINYVRVRGAREHNLKSVDVDIPRDALVVFSGVSGSGKSSLAFNTIYAEAQRRYLESVAPYARRLMDQVGTPEFDTIEGLPPAVALRQQRGSTSARSSVGSITTLSSLLRMLFSRCGKYPLGQGMLFAEDFSPNTPQGACPNCHGLGRVYEVTEKSMVPDDTLTIRERAIAAWPPAWHGQNLRDILVTLGYDIDKPWRELPKKDRDWILFTDDHPSVPVYAGFTRAEVRRALRIKTEPSYQGTFTGARNYVLHTFSTTQSPLMKKRAARFMVEGECTVCHGKRIKPEALSITFAGSDIAALSGMPLARLAALLEPASQGRMPQSMHVSRAERAAAKSAQSIKPVKVNGGSHLGAKDIRRTVNLSIEKRVAAQQIARSIVDRVQTLLQLGLGYLSLDRATPTLSSGELQRLRLATQIRSNLFGVVYVLDEPSAGLHPADTEALISALRQLKDGGNSLFIVEHNLEIMRCADWLVDVGPDAGAAGGSVVYSGPPANLNKAKASRTAPYLFHRHVNRFSAPRKPQGWLKLEDVSQNNLHGIDVEFPIGAFTAVTGVSGSGKSSLVSQSLVRLVSEGLGQELRQRDPDEEMDLQISSQQPGQGRITEGLETVKRLVEVDQKPIGRTPRSNLATYTGLFDTVRKLFAATPMAKTRHYDAGHFSFNVAKGRCETCEGEGAVSVELLFMPSVYAPCPTCNGARYNSETLQVQFRGKNIAEVLQMSVTDARQFFGDQAAIHRPLALLEDIGLGYLTLGQPATDLSGGEAQRVKLGSELQRVQRGNTLYVLDEPTIGLHPADVDRLLVQLNGLVDSGNTVVVVEHDMRVLASCDWIIDMGPGAGQEGGEVVVTGTPQTVAACTGSQTAKFLSLAIGN